MRKIAAALALGALPAFAAGAEPRAVPRTVWNTVELKPTEWFRVDADAGRIEVFPIVSGPAIYEVKFQPDRRASPTAKDYEDSSTSFSPDQGLVVHAGKHLGARIRIGVPAAQPVAISQGTGRLEIGRLTGRIEARLENGRLQYDARGLPAGICVDALAEDGHVDSRRRSGCKPGLAKLRVHAGRLIVK